MCAVYKCACHHFFNQEFCGSVMKQFDVVAVHMTSHRVPLLVVGTQSLEDDFLAYWIKLRISEYVMSP